MGVGFKIGVGFTAFRDAADSNLHSRLQSATEIPWEPRKLHPVLEFGSTKTKKWDPSILGIFCGFVLFGLCEP